MSIPPISQSSQLLPCQCGSGKFKAIGHIDLTVIVLQCKECGAVHENTSPQAIILAGLTGALKKKVSAMNKRQSDA